MILWNKNENDNDNEYDKIIHRGNIDLRKKEEWREKRRNRNC